MFKKLLLVFVFALVVLLPVHAQEDIVLVEFIDESYDITGVHPEGWEALGQGLYTPNRAGYVLLALQSAPLPAAQVMTALQPQLGLSAAPEPLSETTTESLTWTIYQIDVIITAELTIRVDLALAEQTGKTYIALLQAPTDQYQALHESVFIPVLASIAPYIEPSEIVPYRVEEVTFTNSGLTLSGTLTLPEGDRPFPAVVLMTGSGGQTRDEEVVPGFPLFKLIADHLTRAGIAVLRYDDRGVGFSEGDYNAASIYDLASDGQAAVNFLRGYDGINADEIGILGHSEGGVYASILGATPDNGIAFIISLAGPGAVGSELLVKQNVLLMGASGATEEAIANQVEFLNTLFPLVAARDWDAMEQLAYESIYADLQSAPEAVSMTDEQRQNAARQGAASVRVGYAAEWFASLMEYDPAPDWANTTVPVLAIFGGLDLQVDAEQNSIPMESALSEGGNEDFTILTLPDANHLFQSALTGAIEEYSLLDYTFTPELLPTITDWLLARVTVTD
jgi:hypothetical protein